MDTEKRLRIIKVETRNEYWSATGFLQSLIGDADYNFVFSDHYERECQKESYYMVSGYPHSDGALIIVQSSDDDIMEQIDERFDPKLPRFL
jgi:hypothetical protein